MKNIIYLIFVLFVAFLFFALKPINNSKENSIEVTGTLKSVQEGGVKDVVFELENNSIKYYINRGFEKGFELTKTKKDFEGKKIKLFYADSWTPLAPFGLQCKHISHLVVHDSVVYNEW